MITFVNHWIQVPSIRIQLEPFLMEQQRLGVNEK